MEFTTWGLLGTYAGALAMVMVITQLTKGLAFLKGFPTQLLSYIIALLILYPANYFMGQLDLSNAILILFNGAIIALSANGGYEAVCRLFGKKT